MKPHSSDRTPHRCEVFRLEELEAASMGQLDESRYIILAEHTEICRFCNDAMERLFAEQTDSFRPIIQNQEFDEQFISFVAKLDVPPPKLEDYKPGDHIGPYQVVSLIGKGGSSKVYECIDHQMNRHVAVKVFFHQLGSSSDPARQEREVHLLTQLDHPCIVRAIDTKPFHFPPYTVMELVPGGQSGSLLKHGPLAPQVAVRLVAGVAHAIHHAHKHGVLHRDIKPSNLLVMERFDPDQPIPDTLTLKVSDFGLARPLFGDSSLTRSDQIVGTPAYMSPEQARSEHRQLGPASDVYSIGVVLYEFLVNRPPLVADNALETLRLITDVEPVPPRRIRQGISRDLDTICMKCLQKKPSERYASAAELADDLQRLLENRPIKARPIGPVHRLYRWCQRNPAMAALFFVLLITITAITYLSLHVSLIENQLRLEAETRSLITEKANQQATVNQAEIEIRDVITLQSTGLCKECIKILSRIIQQALLSKPGEPNFTQWQSLGNRASYLLAKQKLILNDNADAIKILTAAQKQFRLVPDLSRYSRLQILERHILLDLLREKLDKKESVVLIKEIDGEIESLKASREKTVIQN